MKNNIIKTTLVCILIQSLSAIGGMGFYGNMDIFSATPIATTEGDVTVTPQSIDSPFAGGVMLYIDALPFVDLEADFEISLKSYDFENKVGEVSKIGTFQYSRFSQYYTVRREIVGVSIPIVAKMQIYGGAGFNMHTVTPSVSVDFIKGAFGAMDLDAAAGQDFSDSGTLSDLVNYMDENKISSNGYHIQVGFQGKLLMLNLFANARYTIAKDVVPGEDGFASIWTGLAFGF